MSRSAGEAEDHLPMNTSVTCDQAVKLHEDINYTDRVTNMKAITTVGKIFKLLRSVLQRSSPLESSSVAMSGFRDCRPRPERISITAGKRQEGSWCFETTKMWWRFKTKFDNFISAVEREYIAFSQIIEILLAPLDISDADQERLQIIKMICTRLSGTDQLFRLN
ncbi:hypothetical protein QQZ08_009358 [Neonectria magnoliae]|uniref:Uncharacterized protein n=1 Tax=Neonectria magnoliae TaxID=2732573 RepID=A0ABR1HPK6_9HYPO